VGRSVPLPVHYVREHQNTIARHGMHRRVVNPRFLNLSDLGDVADIIYVQDNNAALNLEAHNLDNAFVAEDVHIVGRRVGALVAASHRANELPPLMDAEAPTFVPRRLREAAPAGGGAGPLLTFCSST